MQSKHGGTRWYEIPVRVVLWTFIGTLISFAVSLFLGIVGIVIASAVRGAHPDMSAAYRHVAVPAALVAGIVILLFAVRMEVQHYRENKTLEQIERAS